MEKLETHNSSVVLFHEASDSQTRTRANKEIGAYTQKTFNASHIVIITYKDVFYRSSLQHPAKFQAVLVSDGAKTFIILYYKSVGQLKRAVVGYSNAKCDWNWFRGKREISNMHLYTNTGFTGQYIFPVTTNQCMNEGM